MTTDVLVVQPIDATGVAALRDAGLTVHVAADTRLDTLRPHLATARAAIVRNEGLSGEAIEAPLEEGGVAAAGGAFHCAGTAVGRVSEERVADVLHVNADLVGSAGFELAFDPGDGAETLEDPVMGHGVLALLPGGENLLQFPVPPGPTDVTGHRAIPLQIPPNQRHVTAF